ncbi:divalent-cation tolerance protein CutA [Allosphingosinicella deserti]|uniref:Divalent-cation tolerance protein CutA n=1 Tax=Allosphingosinicella deserti TaxID=2116704 RepID=A0A2P7QVX3_9SPHN|nr:divalent-cation tolerance protein CutA [Sphingomonas deserti]PSJ42117.1 divalent-cation tolerance protein CutA [Sphingomonas deserti]
MSDAPQQIVTVYAVFASDEEAARIARILIDERLTACVNILGPCRSLYRWDGRIEDATEVAALFKTAAEQAEALIGRLAELHSYDLPAAAIWPISAATPGYAKWVLDETRPS